MIHSISQNQRRSESIGFKRIASENEPRTMDKVEKPLSSDRATEAKKPWIHLRTTVESLYGNYLPPLLVGGQ